MSTKTLRKRIALVAVSAMGFGLLSAAPSSAAVTSIALAGPARAGGAAVSVVATGTGTQTYVAAVGAGLATAWNYVSTGAPAGGAATFTPVAVPTTLTTGASIGTIAPTVEGSYTGYVYFDANHDGVLTAGEDSSIFNFTTSGAPASISVTGSAASVAAGVDLTYTVSLLNAAGGLTQSKAGEFVTLSAIGTGIVTPSAGDTSSVVVGLAAAASTATLLQATFNDGVATFNIQSNTGADTVTITSTPSIALVAQGAAAKTNTFTTIANTSSTAIKSTVPAGVNNTGGATAVAATSVTAFSFVITGLGAGAAVSPTITQATGTFTVDGAAYTSGAALNRIADASGSVTLVVVPGALAAANNLVYTLDANGALGNGVDQVNATLTYKTPVYITAIAVPTVATVLQASGTTVTVSGTSVDQWGNPAAGNIVTVAGAATGGTNRTGTSVVSTSGTWSVTLAAADAATTALVITVTTTGATSDTEPAASSNTINFSTTGLPTAVTILAGTGAAAVGNQTTTLPQINVTTDGIPSTVVVDDTFTIADSTLTNGVAADGAEVIKLDSVSTPAGANITYTAGDSSVLLSATAPTTAFTGSSSVTVQAGTDVFAWSNKPGTHSVVMTAGALTSTSSFHVAAGTAARFVALSGPSTLANGAVGTYTATVTDAFGNPVLGVVLSAAVSGLGFINGSLTSVGALTATDAAGTTTFSVVGANGGTGTVTVTVTGTAAQMTAAAALGQAAGNASASSAVTITASTVKTAAELAADAAATAAAAAAVATATALAALQTSVNDAIDMATEASSNADAAISAAQDAIAAGDAANATASDALDAATLAADNADAATVAATAAGETAQMAVDSADNAAVIAQMAVDSADNAAEIAQMAADNADAATTAASDATEAAIAAGEIAQNAVDSADAAGEIAQMAADSAASAADLAAQALEAATNAGTSADAATDAALDAVAAAQEATTAASSAADAADAATAAALDAVAAANDAKDAANAASDAVAALAASIAIAFDHLKAQITALTVIIVKIQRKLKA